MYEASDVANFFTNLCLDDAEDYITNQKLNNLMYFAQGWSLALLGRPLFSNEIQAWRYGPVIPAIYHEYRNPEIKSGCGGSRETQETCDCVFQWDKL